MQLEQWIDLARGLLNLPDLIILAVLLTCAALGFRRGFFGALAGLVGRLVALAAAFFAARAASPIAARWIVTPIVGDLFARQAALGQNAALLEGLRQTVTEAAAAMAESIAFLILFLLCAILFGWLVVIAAKSLRFVARLTPLGVLDALAGGLIGLISGLLLIALALIGTEWFFPITYSPLGWLSPERIANTLLLAKFVEVLPVAF